MPGSTLTDHEAQHVRMIRDAQEKVIAANALLEVRVIRAREQRVAWQIIANAMGHARQSVSERFGRLPEIEALEAAKRG